MFAHDAPCFEKYATKSEFWSCLTYETKKDFHKQLKAEGYPLDEAESSNDETGLHLIYSSQGWPANHENKFSLAWDSGHASKISSTWPANHGYMKSIGE